MPSAAAKSVNATAPLAKTPDLLHEPIKNVVSVLEKKLRNLEKRKIKLVETKRKADEGSELNEDQKKALENLTLVENSLTTVKEVHKTLTGLEVEYSKLLKREQKRTKQEQKVRLETNSQESVCRTIQIQAILGEFSDEIRSDFLNGTNGACQLTSEELSHLDAFYELIDLSPDNEAKVNFSTHVKEVGIHLWNLSEGKDKEVLENITYKQLNDSLIKIQESGYFDKDNAVENAVDEELESVEQEEEVGLVQSGGVPAEPESDLVAPVENNHQDEFAKPDMELHTETFIENPEPIMVQPSTKAPVGGMETMNGVDLPPEVQQMEQTPDNEKIDFMGESEIPPAMLESQQLSLNPVSPEFIPRNMLPIADDGNGWTDPAATNEWNDTSNPDVEWQQASDFHQGNQQGNVSGGFRGGRGGHGGNRGYGGRGRGRGGSGGNFRGNRQDNYRDGNYRGGNRGNRGGGGNRGPRGGPRGGNRGGRGFGGGAYNNRSSAPQ